MADTETTLRSIQQRISQAQSAKARAQVEYEHAKERLEASRGTLKEEFGVSTTAEAKSLIAQLDQELDQAIREVEEALAAAGA